MSGERFSISTEPSAEISISYCAINPSRVAERASAVRLSQQPGGRQVVLLITYQGGQYVGVTERDRDRVVVVA